MPKKFFIIACEPSGDSHAAHLMEEIRKKEPFAEFLGLGGPQMLQAGASLIYDMTTISALGLGDVIRQYFKYRSIFYQALRAVDKFKPDSLILVDSPAFNLRFAKKINKKIPVIYYISPQIWAWGKRRIRTIQRTVSKMLVILPFEVAIYEKAGVPCEFVGHPLLDKIPEALDRDEIRKHLDIKKEEKAIGILPGSRQKEVKRILPLMLKAIHYLNLKDGKYRFFLTRSSNISQKLYDEILRPYAHLNIIETHYHHYETLTALDFALITSGTATLESAIIGTPFFLLYKASWSTYILGKQLVKVPYLGLVNLLANKRIVPEFIQNDIHPETIAHEIQVLLNSKELFHHMKREFEDVRKKLGEKGASQRAAQSILDYLSSQ
ncbi:MAG: lipid-A-disaccharide synthase [Candidatus Omnitrophica bacterium]|nr:lipid-A-disaccharide synthase [Candidatus Omnitrophota bacterium]